MSSIWGRKEKQGPTQQTNVTPKFYGPGKIMLPQQKEMWGKMAPTVLEQAMQGGYSPAERSRMMTRMSEDINRPAQAAMGNLRNIYGQAGIRGGVQRSDIGDIMEAKIGATGEASRAIEGMSRDESNRRWQRLMKLSTWKPPFAVGSESRSTSVPSDKYSWLGSIFGY